MKTPILILSVIAVFCISVGISFSQPAITNGTFDGTNTGWNNCGLTGPEMSYPETNYGGSTSDYVAEIDNGDSKGICQTISGFTSGASAASTPNIYINYQRRIQGFAPSTVALQVCLTDASNAANFVCTTITDNGSSWGAYNQLNWNPATPTITSGTSLILSIKSVASPYYDQGGAYCPEDPSAAPNDYLCSNTYGMVVSYVGFTSTPLPITLVNFAAVKNSSAVDLDWQIATEINNDYFVAEKSKNGVDFTTVGIVDGAGNSQSTLNYQATDHSPYNGISYYRLKQVDYDGKFSYSKIVAVKNDGDAEVEIYPNPTQGSFRISVSSEDQPYSIEIADLEGKLVYKGSGNPDNPVTEISGLSKGVYVVRIFTGSSVTLRKMVVL
jgi:hypothetical protein